MNELFINFLLFMQTTTGHQIFFDKTEKTFIKRVGELYYYFDKEIGGKILDISEDNIISVEDLARNGESSDFYRTFIGNLSENHRNFIGQSSEKHQNAIGTLSDNNRNIIGQPTELYRKNIGKIPEILYKLPLSENEEINELATKIENITIDVLKHTDKSTTIKETVKRYRQAEKLIKKSDISELYKLHKRIKLTRTKQPATAKAEKTVIKKAKIRRFISLAVAVPFVVFIITFFAKNKIRKIETAEITTIETKEQLSSLLNEVLSDKDTILTDWRTEYVLKNISVPISENEAKQSIYQLIIYK